MAFIVCDPVSVTWVRALVDERTLTVERALATDCDPCFNRREDTALNGVLYISKSISLMLSPVRDPLASDLLARDVVTALDGDCSGGADGGTAWDAFLLAVGDRAGACGWGACSNSGCVGGVGVVGSCALTLGLHCRPDKFLFLTRLWRCFA